MKRRLLIAAIFLLAGAVVNVAVAWAMAGASMYYDVYGWPVLALRWYLSSIRHGFVVNTLLSAVVLWLLICGPFVLRRVIRVRRGLCPACAYLMGESDVCSECGKALPGRPTVAT